MNSKYLKENNNHFRVLDVYKKYSWLTGVHIHVGSQGLPIDLFVKAARVR